MKAFDIPSIEKIKTLAKNQRMLDEARGNAPLKHNQYLNKYAQLFGFKSYVGYLYYQKGLENESI
jgi:hypothetical protein